MNEELKKIKKKYGEELMHLCRKLFPTILETPNLLYSILEEHFGFSKMLASDIIENDLIEDFRNYINSFVLGTNELKEVEETPEELLKKAGYNLYECKTEEDIQKFKKYYKSGEELCTFNGGRLRRCYVFFAVKCDAQKIKREDFQNPKRQDEYGTSVISIQFSRGDNNTLSIKNRYNHTVNNPDATYNNNLEKIIPGLTKSFEKHYGLNINSNIYNESSFLTDELQYVLGSDNKYYRYNMEINNIYYCENNIIVDNGKVITKYNKEKERYILIDYFIIDKKEKNITLYDETIEDSFIDTINKIGKIKDIIEIKEKEVIIIYEDLRKIKIKLDKTNNIIGYTNNYVEKIGDNFLCNNYRIAEISLENVLEVGNNFLYYNIYLKHINLPKVEKIGNSFLYDNESLRKLNLKNVLKIGYDFLYYNKNLIELNLENALEIGNDFLYFNKNLEYIKIPKVEIIGESFLYWNENLTELNLESILEIGNDFLIHNKILKKIELPKVETIGYHFLYWNENLTELNVENVQEIGESFLYCNENLENIKLLKLKRIGDNFLFNNKELRKVDLPKVETIGDFFLYKNKNLIELNLESVEEIGYSFLHENRSLEYINIPEIQLIMPGFLIYNAKMNEKVLRITNENLNSKEPINLPKIKKISNKIKKCLKIKNYKKSN